jgi:hypothetical protein
MRQCKRDEYEAVQTAVKKAIDSLQLVALTSDGWRKGSAHQLYGHGVPLINGMVLKPGGGSLFLKGRTCGLCLVHRVHA